jgi:hypothetical protein
MTDTSSVIMLARLQSTGSNNNIWGGYLVDNQNITEKQAQGYEVIALTGDQTLSFTSYSTTNIGQSRTVKFTGSLTSGATVTYPALKAQRTFINAAGAPVTVKCAAGVGVAIPNGYAADLYCDGVDYYERAAQHINGDMTVAGQIHGLAAGTALTDAVNRQQMEAAITGAGNFVDAPSDGNYYTRNNMAWQAMTYTVLPGKPATFTPSPHIHSISDVTGLQGALDTETANRTNADATLQGAINANTTAINNNTSAINGKVSKSGDTVTGALQINQSLAVGAAPPAGLGAGDTVASGTLTTLRSVGFNAYKTDNWRALVSGPSAIIDFDPSANWSFYTGSSVSGGALTALASRFYVATNGDFIVNGAYAQKASGTTWANPSDVRIKQDILPYQRGLDEILKLNPVSFRYRPETNYPQELLDQVQVGLIAQQVETVMPDMVSVAPGKIGDIDLPDLRTLDTNNLVFALVRAVQTLAARVTELEQKPLSDDG